MRAALIVALSIVVVSATACATQPSRPGPDASALRFAIPNEPLAVPVIVTYESDLFTEHGVTVDATPVECCTRALDALIEGEYDVSLATDVALAARSIDSDGFRILATVAVAEDDSRVVARRSAGIETAADLAGKRIGVVRSGQAHCYLHTLLESESLLENAVELVFLENSEGHDALHSGDIDAYATRPPMIGRLVGDLRSDAVILEAPVSPTKTLSLVVRDDVLEHRPDDVALLLSALIESEELTSDRQHVGSVGAPWLDTLPDVLSADVATANFRVQLDQALIVALEEQMRWIIGSPCFEDVPSVTAMPDVLTLVDPSPLWSLDPSRVRIIGWEPR